MPEVETVAAAACPACGGPVAALHLRAEDRYRLHRCRSCGTEVFLLEQRPGAGSPRESAYWEEYKFAVYGDDAVRAEFEQRYRTVLELAEGALGPLSSVLDVGCGVGNFLAFAEQAGMRAVGSDVEPRAVAAARRRGLTAHLAGELDAAVPDGSVDAATMWDVIEHLLDPSAGVAAMARKVRPGGALLFETPDAAFPARRAVLGVDRILGGRGHLSEPFYYVEHRVYFTEAGLRALLARHGCRVVAVRRAGSPRRKMARLFAAEGGRGDRVMGALGRAWPLLSAASERLSIGNKLLVVAERTRAQPVRGGW